MRFHGFNNIIHAIILREQPPTFHWILLWDNNLCLIKFELLVIAKYSWSPTLSSLFQSTRHNHRPPCYVTALWFALNIARNELHFNLLFLSLSHPYSELSLVMIVTMLILHTPSVCLVAKPREVIINRFNLVTFVCIAVHLFLTIAFCCWSYVCSPLQLMLFYYSYSS